MKNKLLPFIELARLDKPVGIYLLLWPSLLGLVLAGTSSEVELKNYSDCFNWVYPCQIMWLCY